MELYKDDPEKIEKFLIINGILFNKYSMRMTGNVLYQFLLFNFCVLKGYK